MLAGCVRAKLCSLSEIISLKKYSIFTRNYIGSCDIKVIYEGYIKGEPCIIKNLTTDWAARRRWTKDNFLENYGDGLFEFGRDADTDEYIYMTVKDFFNKGSHGKNPLYLFDKTFDLSCPSLREDYHVPDIFKSASEIKSLVDEEELKWLLVGDVGSGSRLHVDPNGTSAWNALAVGMKEWIIISPGSKAEDDALFELLDTRNSKAVDGINTHFESLNRLICEKFAGISNRRIYHFTHETGDIVYVPSGWLHAVRNLNYTAGITYNFKEY